jgi:hypothetical protein
MTHEDDVADAQRWAKRFAERVWIHEHDAHAAGRGPEAVIDSSIIASSR